MSHGMELISSLSLKRIFFATLVVAEQVTGQSLYVTTGAG
jgi:hypothetical protein